MSPPAGDVVEAAEKKCQVVDDQLHVMIKNEQFLCDLIPNELRSCGDFVPSVKSVDNTLSLHFGQAMKLTLLRGDGVELPCVVPISACVLDLRRAVQNTISEFLEQIICMSPSEPQSYKDITAQYTDVQISDHILSDVKTSLLFHSPRFISWKSVWRSKSLAVVSPHSLKPPFAMPSITCILDDPNGRLHENYGIRNGTVITFVNRLKRR
ncbi:unnamed protein product [Dicrocoelium dendriticum]|nr:unnamed protein product [Dicrocoelium dendriticum]